MENESPSKDGYEHHHQEGHQKSHHHSRHSSSNETVGRQELQKTEQKIPSAAPLIQFLPETTGQSTQVIDQDSPQVKTTPSQTTITFQDPPASVVINVPESIIKIEKKLEVDKPKIIVTRIYGVTTLSAFGDQMYKYFLAKLPSYLSDHFDDPNLQEIITSLREQNQQMKSVELPSIAASDEPKEMIISSIVNFIKTRAEINRTEPDSMTSRTIVPAYIQLKSLVFRSGLQTEEIVSHVYEDAAAAFKVWSEAGVKLYTLSSGTIDVQADFFSKTNQGNLEEYFTGHISTVNPHVSSGESNRVDFRQMAKKILKEETPNVLLLTDKLHEAKAATKTGMIVVLVAREGRLGHLPIQEVKEQLSPEVSVVMDFKSIIFT